VSSSAEVAEVDHCQVVAMLCCCQNIRSRVVNAEVMERQSRCLCTLLMVIRVQTQDDSIYSFTFTVPVIC
jgi:hypothetical protein